MFRTPKRLFRALAIAEAISWTILLGALLIRTVAGLDLAVTIGGAIHGFVFLSYGATAVLVALNQRWSILPASVAIGSAIVPYATIPTEVWLRRSGRLTGAWRSEASSDPRDGRPLDRMLRFFLRRPWVLGLLLVAGIVVAYVVLLTIGPPGGRR
jgi:integral membrane protein